MKKDFKKQEESRDYIRRNIEYKTFKEMAKSLGKSENAVKKIAGRLGLSRFPSKNSGIINVDNILHQTKKEGDEMKDIDKKTGLEIRDDYVVNWSNKTIVTDLGEFGTYVCSFSAHGAIQRYYVDAYEGKGHTATDTATKFEFYNNKAVYKYAKIHNFTKSSPGQTDFEFELGLTAEEAEEENWRAEKRRSIKRFEIRKWKETQKDADRWNDLENSVILPMKDWVNENLSSYKPPLYKPVDLPSMSGWVVGLADFHYLKWAYNHKGKTVFNRKVAEKELEKANNGLITLAYKLGKPERIFIPMGNDNYSIDSLREETTSGTPQAGQVDGNWRLDLENYFRLCIGMIELYSQIAPVTVVPMEGNHDRHTSIALHAFLKILFEKRENVSVINNQSPRVYTQYGKNALMFTHGDTMSQPKLKKEAHRLFMAEAKQQGVKINQISNYTMFSGHIHTDSFEDLGVIKHFIIPSLAPPDQWHTEKGYVGNRQEASLYVFDKKEGRKAVLYS